MGYQIYRYITDFPQLPKVLINCGEKLFFISRWLKLVWVGGGGGVKQRLTVGLHSGDTQRQVAEASSINIQLLCAPDVRLGDKTSYVIHSVDLLSLYLCPT